MTAGDPVKAARLERGMLKQRLAKLGVAAQNAVIVSGDSHEGRV
jgi:hypothetical protein